MRTTANGELRKRKRDTTREAVTTYGYDGAGNLRKVVLPDGSVIEYVIDAVGRRVAKKNQRHHDQAVALPGGN